MSAKQHRLLCEHFRNRARNSSGWKVLENLNNTTYNLNRTCSMKRRISRTKTSAARRKTGYGLTSQDAMKAAHKQKGFMLLELLVVVSVIALLLSILMPAMRRTRKRTNTVTCRSNLMQWGHFFSMYTSDNNGFFSSGCIAKGNGERNTVWYDDHGWVVTLRPYYGNRKILHCPDAVDPVAVRRAAGSFFCDMSSAWELRSRNNTLVSGSYGINSWVYNRNDAVNTAGGEQYRWKKLEVEVRGADRIPLLLDCCWLEGYPQQQNCPPEYCRDLAGEADQMKRFCVPRHNTRAQGLFFDLSVDNIGLKALWELKWHRNYNVYARAPAEFSDPAHWMYGLRDY